MWLWIGCEWALAEPPSAPRARSAPTCPAPPPIGKEKLAEEVVGARKLLRDMEEQLRVANTESLRLGAEVRKRDKTIAALGEARNSGPAGGRWGSPSSRRRACGWLVVCSCSKGRPASQDA